MAIDRPKAIGDAPARGPERSGGRRRETFLPREEWARAQGKKVLSDGVAARTIEAQPVFGQIKPSKRPGASARRTAISGDDLADFGCATQGAETFRCRERKYLQQMVVLSAEYEPRAKGPTVAPMWAKLRSEQPGRSVSEDGATNPRRTRRLSFNAVLRRLGGRDEGEGLALPRGCRENRLRRILHHPHPSLMGGAPRRRSTVSMPYCQ